MTEFASKGVGVAGLTTGVIGTALGALNGGLGNIFGVGCARDSVPVSRYDAELQARIAELETEVKLRDANTFTMGEMGKLRDYVDSKFAAVNAELCEQKVYNATNIATVNCLAGQVAQLMSLTKLVIPNSSICPGYGNVTVTPATAATA